MIIVETSSSRKPRLSPFHRPRFIVLLTTDITLPIMAAALMQFPLYGFIIGYSLSQRKVPWAAIVVAIHIAAALACFSGLIPNFS
jgi:hypothetical protein